MLQGKACIVTGASRGIGEGIARALAREGASVVLASRSGERLNAVAAEIRAAGGVATVQITDVCSPEQVEETVEATAREYGSVDILVNNAGVASIFPTDELTLEEWERVMRINLRGAFLCCQAAGRKMVAQGSGRIINIASLIGFLGFPRRAAYGASKAGVINLTLTLACEWSKHGVTVNAISPGYVHTPMLDEDVAQGKYDLTDILRRTPTGRLVEIDEIAAAAVFLSSDAARSITGINLPVDGGWQAYGYT